MSDVTYRWMSEDDIPALIPLAHRIWHVHYPSIISVAQIDYMLATRFTAEIVARQMDEGQRYLLAMNEAPVGFASVGPLSKVEPLTLRGTKAGATDYFLHRFYLASELQGKGVGTKMLRELETGLPNLERMRLQVARANANAWNFYQKRGFTIVGQFDFDIGQGYQMLDYVMEKRF